MSDIQNDGEQVLPDGWTEEDIRFLLERLEEGPILIADRNLGIPTIHSLGGEVRHLGFGLFRLSTADYTVTFDAGGAMRRTPGGKGWTKVNVQDGAFPYDAEEVCRVLLAWLEPLSGGAVDVRPGLPPIREGDVIQIREGNEWVDVEVVKVASHSIYVGDSHRWLWKAREGWSWRRVGHTHDPTPATLYRDWLSIVNGDESLCPSGQRLAEYRQWAGELVIGGSREKEGADFRRFCRVRLEGMRRGLHLAAAGVAYEKGRDFPAPEGWECLQETDEYFYNRSWEEGRKPAYPCVRCGCEPDQKEGWRKECGKPAYLCPACLRQLLAWKDGQIEKARAERAKRDRAYRQAKAAARDGDNGNGRKPRRYTISVGGQKLVVAQGQQIEVDLGGRFPDWTGATVRQVRGRWLYYRLPDEERDRRIQVAGCDIVWRMCNG